MNKKLLVLTILLTFSITATLFSITPTHSATNPYNPWDDVTGPTPGISDGIINMRDINYLILRFNTQGDTTRNVSITNFPLDENGNLMTTTILPQGTFETSERISILSTSNVGHLNDGIFAAESETFPFTFNPITSNFTVTDLCLNLIYNDEPDALFNSLYDFSLNNIHLTTSTLKTSGSIWYIGVRNYPIHIENQTTYNALHQGINYLTIDGANFTIQQIDLLTAYTYCR